MKRLLAAIAAVSLAAICLTGCAQGAGSSSTSASKGSPSGSSVGGSDRISIVTTIFPEYDWVMQILGANASSADITLLLDSGADLHSYQPSAADIAKISTCDVFVYVGGESDKWVKDVLAQAENKDMVAVNLMEVFGDKALKEEVVEGMEAEHDHDATEEGHDHEHSEEAEFDEHVWLSPKNAKTLVSAIADALAKADPQNASVYATNMEAYGAELAKLDDDYRATVAAGARNTLLFADRFPFRYLTEDYKLNYYAAFVGCSAETEASFETVLFLANKVDELKLPVILTIENSDGKIAETVRQNTAAKDAEVLVMDSMQSTASSDIAKGTTYLSIMRNNLDVLARALA